MCGLAGIIGKGAERAIDRVEIMTNVLAHRGPDDHGYFTAPSVALGHRRLAIQDLSDAAAQPFRSASGRYMLVYNGEIYNFQELRRELAGPFHSTGDTEVLIAAWERWGPDCLERLRGMFAFAIWDEVEQRLYLARDRFGIKPLFFAQHEGMVHFASEIKALLAAGVPAQPNRKVIADYLVHGLTDHSGETFFSGIHRLAAGCWATLSPDDPVPVERRYYDIGAAIGEPADSGLTIEQAQTQYRDLLFESVSQHLIADVDVGFSVSGGIDSSAMIGVAHNVQRNAERLRAYSIDYREERYSERSWVEALASHAGCACDFITIDETEVVSYLPSVVRIQDEPFGGIPTASWGAFFQHCTDQATKVIVDGNGADECLAGYFPDTALRMAQLFNSRSFSDFRPEAEAFMEFWNLDQWQFLEALKNALQPTGWSIGIDGSKATASEVVRPEITELVGKGSEQSSSHPDALVQRSLFRLGAAKLPRALRFADRNSMAFSIELRLPFLDHKLVEFCLRLPPECKVHQGRGKHVMREALIGILPEDVRSAPKRSVQTPQREWFRSGPLSELMRDVLDDPSPFLAELVDIAAARGLFDRYRRSGGPNSNPFWQWLNLDLWYRSRIAQFDASPPSAWPDADIRRYEPAGIAALSG